MTKSQISRFATLMVNAREKTIAKHEELRRMIHNPAQLKTAFELSDSGCTYAGKVGDSEMFWNCSKRPMIINIDGSWDIIK